MPSIAPWVAISFNEHASVKTLRHSGLPRANTAAVAAFLVLIPVACSRDAAARPDSLAVQPRVEELTDSSHFKVAHPERFPLVSVVSRAVPDRLSGTCVVSPDVNRSVPVNALGGGRVVELKATLGEHVTKGEALVTSSSPDLSSALSDYHKAIADEVLSRKQIERSRVLFEHGSIARKDLEVAEDAEQKAQIDVRTTENRVRMLGGDPARPTPVIELKAPIEGTIIEQNVTRSAGVKSPDNAPNLFTIADLSRVWVLCDVYDNHLSRPRVGQLTRIRLNAYPDRTFTGRVGNISEVLDPSTRTAKMRVEMDNRDGVMRPGMFASAELESAALRSRMLLPTTALIQLHDGLWVFIKTGAASFQRVPVQGGREIEPGIQEILQGVTPGQAVVRNALQFVQTVEQ